MVPRHLQLMMCRQTRCQPRHKQLSTALCSSLASLMLAVTQISHKTANVNSRAAVTATQRHAHIACTPGCWWAARSVMVPQRDCNAYSADATPHAPLTHTMPTMQVFVDPVCGDSWPVDSCPALGIESCFDTSNHWVRSPVMCLHAPRHPMGACPLAGHEAHAMALSVGSSVSLSQ